ncbi:hypothetical protein L917_10024 [Phytophthora nicotianae]|uniref:Uncharacterized protein n=2 Tax=Phytophthora nicotianae TaxID=4792 RepID=W2R8K7_PHYN3|nr:hypothetical protein PPTG_21123 [Phytophthora nicotianae INRA-310]ETL91423.1 hypothetical protein L917_10024 [Phytophthora nicotianae]ETN21738.1 hypothetical protein PPTG_21123 [Phytophthora nicotianae INRA-310]
MSIRCRVINLMSIRCPSSEQRFRMINEHIPANALELNWRCGIQ